MIVSADKFLLEHFYYGQVVRDGKPVGDSQLLAASQGVPPELAKQAVERVSLPPLIRSAVGAWALVRGRSRQMPFLLVQSQQGDFGQVISHYIIAPSDVLKAMGGNQKALMALVQERLPVFTNTDEVLPLQELFASELASMDTQVENILELMNITNNRTNLIEPLLAAIVQGRQLIVH